MEFEFKAFIRGDEAIISSDGKFYSNLRPNSHENLKFILRHIYFMLESFATQNVALCYIHINTYLYAVN